jgi:hypothetical protein
VKRKYLILLREELEQRRIRVVAAVQLIRLRQHAQHVAILHPPGNERE